MVRTKSRFVTTAALAITSALLAFLPTTPASAAPATAATSVNFPCGWKSAPPATYDHVIWIWMENTSYRELIGSPQAPVFNLMARQCGTAADYYGLTHPSWRNYIASTSGLGWQDAPPNCDPDLPDCMVPFPSLFDQVQDQGKQWRVYSDEMPTACDQTDGGGYVAHHNPAVFYPDLATNCPKWNVPAGTALSGALSTDLLRNQLPAFSFLIAGEGHDMEGQELKAGDNWFAGWMARILTSPAYLSGKTAVMVSFDEGDGADQGDVCATTLDESCHIPTLMITPSTKPGTVSSTYLDHYSLLLTTEQMLGINDYLYEAATAQSMRPLFNA